MDPFAREGSFALGGLRVIDIASLYAAPMVATLLADFGADVIKVEPPGGDSFRGTRMWPLVGRNKRSVVLDLRRSDDAAALVALAETVDVLVENLPAHTRESRGLDHDRLLKANPRLVIVSVSCFGNHGPYANRPGAGTIGEAFAGLTALTGNPDGPPMLPSVPLGDAITALTAAFGAMAAIYERDRTTGSGQVVDVSMYEPVLQLMGPAFASWKPADAPPQRAGNRMRSSSTLRNLYATTDGRWVAVACSTARQQSALIDLIASEDALTESQPMDADSLDRAVAAWSSNRSAAEIVTALAELRIGVTGVNDLADLLADPHVRTRASLLSHDELGLGPMLLPAPAPRLATGSIRTPLTRALGADNELVFRALTSSRPRQ